MFVLVLPRPPVVTRTDTHLPFTTLFRSVPMEKMIPLGESFPGVIAFKIVCRIEQVLAACLALAACERPQTVETARDGRSEEHTSELQSLMRISYAVFCLKKKNNTKKK